MTTTTNYGVDGAVNTINSYFARKTNYYYQKKITHKAVLIVDKFRLFKNKIR